jgi:ATP-dependent Lhr-like helicase
MLAQGIAARRGRYGAYLFRDKVNGRVRGRRGARLVAITNGGAIPETGLYTVVAEPEGTTVGTVDEDFAVESMAGDVMLLGNTSWRIRRVSTAGRVIVEDAHGAAPTIPFWRGEAPARTPELSAAVAELRHRVAELAPAAGPDAAAHRLPQATPAVEWLLDACGLDRSGAEQLADYVFAARTVLGVVPTSHVLVAERFFDEGGGMQLVIHAPLGARINKAWGLALRKRFCRSFNFELQAAATDNGINIALAEQHSFPLVDVFQFLRPATAREVLEQAALASPFFGSRWRWDAGRSLALQRFQHGKKVPVHLQRLRSDDLLASVFPDVAACQENIEGDIQIPDHPLVREVMKDVLTEAMDLPGFLALLSGIADGSIQCVAVDTPVPSVLSHEILNANPYAYLDDAPLEERRARAVELRRTLPETVLEAVGKLDPEAIAEVRRDAWPDVRDADDLHDALQTLVLLPADDEAIDDNWRARFDELARTRRVAIARTSARAYWVAAERARTVIQILASEEPSSGETGGRAGSLDPATSSAGVTFDRPVADVDPGKASRDEAVTSAVQGWLSHIGPATIDGLAARLSLDGADVESAVLRLEATGAVLRGRFENDTGYHFAKSNTSQTDTGSRVAKTAIDVDWCDRRLLARIHRLTLGRLRREIAPVSSGDFMRWQLTWQHVAPGTQSAGDHGLLEVLRQLQGFEAPANAWEQHLLPSRVRGYDPAALDQLCLTGVVGWGRLSPHPATLESADATGPRRVTPTRVAPVTFFVREDADWMPGRRRLADEGDAPARISAPARDVLQLLHRAGASFFPDIVRGTRRLKAEVETALWELVAAGLVTADGFDNLRALIDPRRRAGHGPGRHARPRHSAGRWSLLQAAPAADHAQHVESACWMLLRRYGVVFRELLAGETILPSWRDLLISFRRLEDRGEIRGGRFVSGFIGEQFALPVAVESLRAQRHRAASAELVTITASDPLNLTGVILPGDRVPAISGRFVTFRDGIPIASEDRTRTA